VPGVGGGGGSTVGKRSSCSTRIDVPRRRRHTLFGSIYWVIVSAPVEIKPEVKITWGIEHREPRRNNPMAAACLAGSRRSALGPASVGVGRGGEGARCRRWRRWRRRPRSKQRDRETESRGGGGQECVADKRPGALSSAARPRRGEPRLEHHWGPERAT
jgi:hypothetical protein